MDGLSRRNVEDATVPLSSPEILELMGVPSRESHAVSPERALGIATVFRGVQVLASVGGGLPLKVYRRSDRAEARRGVLGGSADQTSVELWETVIAHMALWGAACIWKERSPRGTVSALVPLHPSRVGVELVRTDDPARPYRRTFSIDGKGGYGPYEVMYIPFLSLDGYRGIGPIGYCRETVGTAALTDDAAAKMFKNGLLLDAVISTDQSLTYEAAKRLKDRWRALAQGVANAHDVAVLDNGAKVDPIGMPAKDAQFIEQRRFTRSEIAGLLGLPGWMVGDESQGAAGDVSLRGFVKTTLRAYTNKIEQRITAELLHESKYAEFAIEGLLRGDAAERAAFYNSGITGGWLVPNDVRPKENLAPVPWGDMPYLPNNTAAGNPIQQGGGTSGGDES